MEKSVVPAMVPCRSLVSQVQSFKAVLIDPDYLIITRRKWRDTASCMRKWLTVHSQHGRGVDLGPWKGNQGEFDGEFPKKNFGKREVWETSQQ